MRELLRWFVVLSAERVDHSVDRNTADTHALRKLLSESPNPFREGTGVFDGVAETSFAVFLSDEATRREDQIQAFVTLARAFRQEAILLVDGERDVELIRLDHGERELIGTWRESLNPASVVGHDHTMYYDQSGQAHYAIVS